MPSLTTSVSWFARAALALLLPAAAPKPSAPTLLHPLLHLDHPQLDHPQLDHLQLDQLQPDLQPDLQLQQLPLIAPPHPHPLILSTMPLILLLHSVTILPVPHLEALSTSLDGVISLQTERFRVDLNREEGGIEGAISFTVFTSGTSMDTLWTLLG
jgi:hypothetical protein